MKKLLIATATIAVAYGLLAGIAGNSSKSAMAKALDARAQAIEEATK